MKSIFVFLSMLFSLSAYAEPYGFTFANADSYHDLYQPFFKSGNDLMDKIINDRGNGYDTLYGVRNLRVVLHGVMYRGGANNSYNKYGKRDNSNPLTRMGLDNLCKEGFSEAVYLYSTNFVPYNTVCTDRWGNTNSFKYTQISPLLSLNNANRILSKVYDVIMERTTGPIYAHCWNGWHASGYISAIALRQWCGFTGKEAEQYWIDGTDAVSNSNYPSIKKAINAYQVDPAMSVSDDVRQAICPANPYH